MSAGAINLRDKLALFSEHWSPRVVAEMNDYQFKLAKLQGEFVWHAHADTDEVFIVLDGELVLRFRDRDVPLSAGEMYVVPKGRRALPGRDEGMLRHAGRTARRGEHRRCRRCIHGAQRRVGVNMFKNLIPKIYGKAPANRGSWLYGAIRLRATGSRTKLRPW